MTTLLHRRIDVALELANDQRFDAQGSANVIRLSGLRVQAHIKKIGQFGEGWGASLRIFGMLEADMNALSVLSFNASAVQLNKVRVSAGDDQLMTQVFSGHIVNGWVDYKHAPDVCFVIEALPDYYNRLCAASPCSFPDNVDVSVVMRDLAGKMGYSLYDNNVNIKLSKGYFDNSLFKQAESIARHTNILMMIEDDVLTISPSGSPLGIKGEVPVITPDNGLVGYPTFNKQGISFRCLFNPAIRYYHQVRLETRQKPVLGEWTIIAVQYLLESEIPDGVWFCQVHARQFNDKKADGANATATG